MVLAAHLLLLCLKRRRPRLDEGIFYRTHNLGWEDGARVQGTRHGLLPRLEHLIHLAARGVIDRCIGLHEGLIELPAKEKRVWSPHILDDGVEQVQGWQLARRMDLLLRVVSFPCFLCFFRIFGEVGSV